MRTAAGGQRRRKGRSAGWILMLLALPLALNAVLALWGGSPLAVLGSAAAFALFIIAGMLARRAAGEAARDRGRRFARRRWPWRRLAGAATALATSVAAYAAAGIDPLTAVLYGVGAGAGFFMAYGWQEEEAGAAPPFAGAAGEEVRTALADGYRRLERIETARAQLALPEFQSRLGNISVGVEKILKSIEADPENLRRARKFLNVYLDGAQKVAEQYARAQDGQSSVEREQNFRTLLVDMENTCQEQYDKLQKREMLDLDVQIEVLSARLRREGTG
jgi:hypothetical protein